jgi:hypothetical protein
MTFGNAYLTTNKYKPKKLRELIKSVELLWRIMGIGETLCRLEQILFIRAIKGVECIVCQ